MERERQAEMQVDGRGWTCDWCILKSESVLEPMKPGQVLELLCTDPRIVQDLPKVLKQRGDELVRLDELSECFRLHLRRGNARDLSSSKFSGCEDGIKKKPQKKAEGKK